MDDFFTQYDPENEYIKTLELSVQMLQREIQLLRNQISKNEEKFHFDDLDFNKNLIDLNSLDSFNELYDRTNEILKEIIEFYELEFYIYNTKDELINPIQRDIKSNLDVKVQYLEEEGIINWALQNQDYVIIQDLTTTRIEKELYFIIIPLRHQNINKGILIISTHLSKNNIEEENLIKLSELGIFLSIAVDNIESLSQIKLMNSRLASLNNKVIESSYLASISGLLKSILIELQRPIKIMETNFKLIENGIDISKTRFEIINEQFRKIDELYNNFKKIIESETNNKKSLIDIEELILDSLGLINYQLKREGISINFNFNHQSSKINCFLTQLSQALINLFLIISDKLDNEREINILTNNNNKNVIINIIINELIFREEEIEMLINIEQSNYNLPYLLEMQYIKKIIEMNNGNFTINYELNKGISFKIMFPRLE